MPAGRCPERRLRRWSEEPTYDRPLCWRTPWSRKLQSEYVKHRYVPSRSVLYNVMHFPPLFSLWMGPLISWERPILGVGNILCPVPSRSVLHHIMHVIIGCGVGFFLFSLCGWDLWHVWVFDVSIWRHYTVLTRLTLGGSLLVSPTPVLLFFCGSGPRAVSAACVWCGGTYGCSDGYRRREAWPGRQVKRFDHITGLMCSL